MREQEADAADSPHSARPDREHRLEGFVVLMYYWLTVTSLGVVLKRTNLIFRGLRIPHASGEKINKEKTTN